ncbi:MAG: bifunctional phosphoglucose/phosphomannose isomerase [bacterium]|nr:bifunctional phosphoglucose/phosphomannose isomerase [bacterium]
MKKIILDFPKQFKIGLEIAKNIRIKDKFDKVLICGMGGSALPGDILEMWLEDKKINIGLDIHRNYGLPYQIDKKYLIICISYSGNTEETISSFMEARKKKIKTIAITSGGELLELCQRHEVPFAKIPQGYQPRMALGFQFSALIKILVNSGIIKNNLENVLALEKNLKPLKLESQAKIIAKKIINKIPIVYTSDKFRKLARIWKIKFNESAKLPAFYNYFPELNHNEMTGFVNLQTKFYVIFLRDSAENTKILKRMKLTAEILKQKMIDSSFIDLSGKEILYKIFSNILLSDWVSYYLALKYKVDPLSVNLQEEFKKKLKR